MDGKIIKLAKVFKALSSEQRLMIFKMIYDYSKENSKSEDGCDSVDKAFTMASSCTCISRSTVSHHFKELQNAGLITCIRKGKCFKCQINTDILKEIIEFMK